MNKNIFFILPILFIIFSAPSFSSQDAKAINSTTTTVSPNPATTSIGKAITFSAKIIDISGSAKTLPTGTVTWNDGGKGGIFNSTSCTLTILTTGESTCTVSYTPSTTGSLTITGTYGGDSSHAGSFGVAQLTVTLRTTTTKISPNPATAYIGITTTFSAKVADPGTGTKTLPTGTVTWNDGGKGGIFNSTSCTLASYKGSTSVSICSVTYTQSKTGSITINGTYGGDSVHMKSSGKTSLTVTLRPTTTVVKGPVSAIHGTISNFNATVTDTGTTGTKTLPTGKVTWSDGGKGGTFSSGTCTLASYKGSTSVSICSVTYTKPTAASVTITGTYGGDSGHTGSFGTFGFTVS